MDNIDDLLEEWKDTEESYRALVEKRNKIETRIISIMTENIWRDYSAPSGIHVSFVEEEESHVDTNQLSILLTKTDLNSVMRYSTKRKLIIITPDGKKRLRKMLKI